MSLKMIPKTISNSQIKGTITTKKNNIKNQVEKKSSNVQNANKGNDFNFPAKNFHF